MNQINHVIHRARAPAGRERTRRLSNAETDRALASLDFQSEKNRSTLAFLKRAA
jgi:hypothetical protein